MLSIFEQNIQKRYFLPILSRGFLIGALCYIIAFIIPVLILVSIGYSWNQNSKTLLKPTIKYENYQLSCLMSDQSLVYDSSFIGDQTLLSHSTIVSIGSDTDNFAVSFMVQGNVLACTLVTYNRILVNNNNEILVTIPFSFFKNSQSSTVHINKISQYGKIQVLSAGFLLDSTIPNQQLNYNNFLTDFSIIDNSLDYSSRNLTAIVDVATEKKEYGTGSKLQFVGNYEIESEAFVRSESLLNKIRFFVPFYMFLWFPVFFYVVLPIVEWMFSSKLYFAKRDKGKIHLD